MKSKDLQWTDWLKLRDELFTSSYRFIKSTSKLNPDIREELIDKSKWSSKDVLSHIVGWDIEVIKQFNTFLVNPDVDDEYDINAFNEKSVLDRKDKSWDDVMNEFKAVQSELLNVIFQLTIDNILPEPRFTEWVKVLIGHYDHHRAKLEELLDD